MRFFFNQHLDMGFYRDGADGPAVIGFDVAGEKVFQLVYAPGRQHVFAGGRPGNGGFMHAHQVGDIFQNHGLHGHFALFEKWLLLLHDALRHLEQGLVAQFQRRQQPASLLKPALEVLGVFSALLAQQADVKVIQLQAWIVVRAE